MVWLDLGRCLDGLRAIEAIAPIPGGGLYVLGYDGYGRIDP
jgi:hypothetical protein